MHIMTSVKTYGALRTTTINKTIYITLYTLICNSGRGRSEHYRPTRVGTQVDLPAQSRARRRKCDTLGQRLQLSQITGKMTAKHESQIDSSIHPRDGPQAIKAARRDKLILNTVPHWAWTVFRVLLQDGKHTKPKLQTYFWWRRSHVFCLPSMGRWKSNSVGSNGTNDIGKYCDTNQRG